MARGRTSTWWRTYRDHLESPEWAAVRTEALARDGHLCQDCGRRRATQAHHRSSDRVGAEYPDDPLSLCGECHRRRHPERARVEEVEEIMP